MKRLRVACVGSGFIAGRHLQALSGFPEVEIVAVADPVRSRAEATVSEFGGRAYDDGLELLAAEELDAVWLCVPPFAHGPLEYAALERDLPFFVEKPLGPDLGGAVQIADRVRASGALTAVGYHWRHLDLVAEASALLRDRPAHLALGHWLDKTPAVQWWSIRAQSGGQLIEQTTHLFDLARLLVGEVSEVRAVEVTRAGEQSDGADVPTASSATLIFASGAIGTISSSCVLDGRARVGLQIVAEGMTVELSERSLVDHELRVNRGGADTVEVSGQDPIESEDREFVDALLGRILKVTVPYDEALRSHALVCAADQSARDGLPVSLDQLHAEARTDA